MAIFVFNMQYAATPIAMLLSLHLAGTRIVGNQSLSESIQLLMNIVRPREPFAPRQLNALYTVAYSCQPASHTPGSVGVVAEIHRLEYGIGI